VNELWAVAMLPQFRDHCDSTVALVKEPSRATVCCRQEWNHMKALLGFESKSLGSADPETEPLNVVPRLTEPAAAPREDIPSIVWSTLRTKSALPEILPFFCLLGSVSC
jgi:hypothetical protein